jgi:hypothetical protein
MVDMGATATTETPVTKNPVAAMVPVDVGAEQAEKALVKKVTAVNTSLTLSNDGKSLVAGQTQLKSLAKALKEGQKAELSPSALTRGLSDQKDPNLQAAARKTLEVELNKSEYAGKIKLPSSADHSTVQNSADTSTQTSQKPAITETIKVNSNISSIGLYESGIQKVEIPSKEGQPPISVLHRAENQTFAHIVVSKVASDGKVTTTIAKVEQGADLTKPIPGADIWTKPKDGTGTLTEDGTGSVSLTEDQQKAVAAVLRNLKQKLTLKSAEPEKPADAGNGGNSPAPGSGTQESGGQSGDRAGAGSGLQSPAPNGGTPTTPPNPTEIKPDGKLDKSEMMRFLTEVGKSSGSGSVTDKIRKQFPDSTVTGDAEKITLNFEGPENPKVTIYWKNGSAGVDFNGDEERKKVWIKQFEQRVKAIVADPNAEQSASASRLMGNPSAVKDLLQRPYVFLSLQAAFGERNVSRDGTDIVVRDLIPLRNVHLKPSGEIELRQAGLFLPELPDAARTAKLTAEVENRLRKFNDGLAKLGDSQGFNQDDKKAVKAWLSGQNADEFKKRLGDGFSTLDNGIKFRTTGYEFIIQESGTVGVRKIEGPFGGSRRPITGGLDLTKAKAVLEGVMADTR